MINVEGDYEEIVRWLNLNHGPGVQYSDSHGVLVYRDVEHRAVRLNYGLFSVIEDFHDVPDRMQTCAAEMSFDPADIAKALAEWDEYYT